MLYVNELAIDFKIIVNVEKAIVFFFTIARIMVYLRGLEILKHFLEHML